MTHLRGAIALVVPVIVAALATGGCANGAAPHPASAPSTHRVTTPASPVVPATTPPTRVAGMARSVPLRVRVPAIGVNSTLVKLGLKADGALAVPSRGMQAGWFTGAPTPGEVGPAVIVGHVHWSGAPGVFAHLDRLKPKDRVTVSRTDGSTAVFAVVRVATFPKSQFPSRLVYGDIDFAGLRLVTCGGYDPVARAYEANVVVFASLVTA